VWATNTTLPLQVLVAPLRLDLSRQAHTTRSDW
jgi:hypothetical protein